MRVHIVQFVCDPEKTYEKHKAVVQPGHLYARKGDTVRFSALNAEFLLIIPRAHQIFENVSPELVGKISKGGLDYKVRGQKRTSERDRNVYPYAVYCFECECFAEGGSSPELIIDI